MERKLASVRRIKAIEDITFQNEAGELEVAQNIVRATVDGWQLVTQKSNNLKPGDLVVYFEIDSVFPEDNPEFSFMEKFHYRLRTIKLKGQVSQGLILPLSIVPPVDFPLEEETDLTKVLGITKYEPEIPAQLRGQVKGNFPNFLQKTDEERLQNCEWILEKYPELFWDATEKLDGTSCTFFIKDGVFGVCSRNLELTETEGNSYWVLARKLGLEEKLKEKGLDNVCIQGELVGPGVQGNVYKLKEVRFFVFNAFDINTQTYFSTEEICSQLGLERVPFVFRIKLGGSSVAALLEEANGKSLINSDVAREGLVFRPTNNPDLRDPKIDRLSFKVVSNKYLLKHQD